MKRTCFFSLLIGTLCRRLDAEVARDTATTLATDTNDPATPEPPVSLQSVNDMSATALRAQVVSLSEELAAKERDRDRLLKLVENCFARVEKFRALRKVLKDPASGNIGAEIAERDERISQLQQSLEDANSKLETQRSHMKAIRDGSLARVNALQEQISRFQESVLEKEKESREPAELAEVNIECHRLRESLDQSRQSEFSVRDELRELCAAGVHVMETVHTADSQSRQALEMFRHQLLQAQQAATDKSQRRLGELVSENHRLWTEINSLKSELRRVGGGDQILTVASGNRRSLDAGGPPTSGRGNDYSPRRDNPDYLSQDVSPVTGSRPVVTSLPWRYSSAASAGVAESGNNNNGSWRSANSSEGPGLYAPRGQNVLSDPRGKSFPRWYENERDVSPIRPGAPMVTSSEFLPYSYNHLPLRV